MSRDKQVIATFKRYKGKNDDLPIYYVVQEEMREVLISLLFGQSGQTKMLAIGNTFRWLGIRDNVEAKEEMYGKNECPQ